MFFFCFSSFLTCPRHVRKTWQVDKSWHFYHVKSPHLVLGNDTQFVLTSLIHLALSICPSTGLALHHEGVAIWKMSVVCCLVRVVILFVPISLRSKHVKERSEKSHDEKNDEKWYVLICFNMFYVWKTSKKNLEKLHVWHFCRIFPQHGVPGCHSDRNCHVVLLQNLTFLFFESKCLKMQFEKWMKNCINKMRLNKDIQKTKMTHVEQKHVQRWKRAFGRRKHSSEKWTRCFQPDRELKQQNAERRKVRNKLRKQKF